ncbi:MAG TPA: hypothetical protein VIM84_11040, partial [Gemmatimonadales bacterium]
MSCEASWGGEGEVFAAAYALSVGVDAPAFQGLVDDGVGDGVVVAVVVGGQDPHLHVGGGGDLPVEEGALVAAGLEGGAVAVAGSLEEFVVEDQCVGEVLGLGVGVVAGEGDEPAEVADAEGADPGAALAGAVVPPGGRPVAVMDLVRVGADGAGFAGEGVAEGAPPLW